MLAVVAGYACVHSTSASGEVSTGGGAATTISDLTNGKLISADGSPYVFPTSAPASSIQYYAIYYSAEWCGPCHAFTPVLVEWYKKFKPSHANFELIFVSEDRDAASMLAFMKEMAMPWPAVRFGDLKHDHFTKGTGIERFVGNGIPDLVLVDAGGKVLSDSFGSFGFYRGPEHVVDDIEKLVPVSEAEPAPPAPPIPAPRAAMPKPTVPATVSAPGPVPAPAPAPAAPELYSAPIKPWTPPDVMPAHPNWTWTTLDGTTYQNVVVTTIGPDTVSITHSMGVAHDIQIADLPPDIQKELSYDPAAAAAARAEAQREEAHPYYTLATLKDAQTAARQMHWPLAWVLSGPELLSATDPKPGSWEDLTQMAMGHLKSESIIIFVDAYTQLMDIPANIREQLFHMDDGPMPGGHHFNPPKIVFSNADVTNTLGRVANTQMAASGAAAIDEVIAAIAKGTNGPPPLTGPMASTTAPPPSSPAIVPVSTAPQVAPATATTPSAPVAAAKPSTDAVKPWAPPDVMPAKPNWTWNSLDGKTYQNVVVINIEPDTVTISHSLGVAHIPIIMLPPDIQKQLNYDPHAASASRSGQ